MTLGAGGSRLPEVGRREGAKGLEREIGTVISVIWEVNHAKKEQDWEQDSLVPRISLGCEDVRLSKVADLEELDAPGAKRLIETHAPLHEA